MYSMTKTRSRDYKAQKTRKCERFLNCNLEIKGENPCIKGKCKRFVPLVKRRG